MRKIMAHRRYFGKWLPQPLNLLIFSFSQLLIFSTSQSLYAQDQFARHAPTVRRLTHIDTVATHFVLPISEAQQASVSGLGTINTLIEEAFSHIGKRYRSGGKGPSAFDCSGLPHATSMPETNPSNEVRCSVATWYSSPVPVRART